MAKKNRKFPIFVITLVIGFALIGISFLQPEFIFGDTSAPFDLASFVGLSIIEVPIDPTGGQILGTVKFGAPIVVPFERSGTILSADGVGGCVRLQEGSSSLFEVPFGRIGSGDRNAEVSWHGYNGVNCGFGYAEWDLADLPNDFVATSVRFQLNMKSVQGAGTSFNNSLKCTVISLGNTVDEITARSLPNRIYFGSSTGGTSIQRMSSSYTPADPTTGDFVAWGGGAYTPSISPALGTADNRSTGTWCKTLGVKSFTFGQIDANGQFSAQKGVDTFNEAVSGGAFTQGTRSDKFTLGFFVNGGGANKFVIDQQWWEENGSLLVTGSSSPIKCGVGFAQVDFRCVPIICDVTETLNQVTNQCETIMCEANEDLTIFEEPVGCIAVCIDDPFTPQIECGSACPDTIQRAVCVPQEPAQCQVVLNCQEGTRPDSNNCSCELIECPIGQELIGDSCQSIVCPINTRLVGNDCVEISCPTGQVAIDNECQDPPILDPVVCETDMFGTIIDPLCIPIDGGVDPTMLDCDTGFKQVGDSCVPIDLDCPAGTEQFENNCRNIIPSLLQVSGIDPTLFLVAGLVIVGMSGVGIVVRRRG